MNEISNNMKISFWASKVLWIGIAICIAIVAGTSFSIVSYAAFALSVAAVVLLSEEDALCFMMMIMPFANIFKSSPEAQSFFTYLFLFYVLWRFLKYQYIHKTFFVTIAILVAYLALQMLFTVNILRTIKFVANILFVYLVVSSGDKYNTKRICLFYIIGVVLSSLVSALDVAPNITPFVHQKQTWGQYEKVSRFAGLYPDPNYYSINVIISLCLIVILNHTKELPAIPAICLAVLLVGFAGMTMSKSAFLMLLLPFLLLMYSKIKKKNYFVFLCVLVAGTVAMFKLVSGEIELFNNILYRITKSKNLDTLTTGRMDIWQSYFEFLMSNPVYLLFGYGLNAPALNGRGSHNTYIDLLYCLGIVGTILLLVVFYVLVNIGENREKRNFLNYSVWLCVGIMYFFLGELFYFDWVFHVVIAIWLSKMNMNCVKEKLNGGA